jgi:hypothetical protein
LTFNRYPCLDRENEGAVDLVAPSHIGEVRLHMKKLFFSQRILDALIDEKRIKLDGNRITILSKDNPTFDLNPAFRFIRTADGGHDPHNLVGEIAYESEIRALQAEIYLDSIMYRETAYVVEPGFIGEKKELLDKLSDTELLTRFLLENLV